MKKELIAGLLRKGYDVRVRVSGRSMAPALRDGDVVTVKKIEARALRRGDLVLRRDGSGEGLLLHRLVSVTANEKGHVYVTRGDALLRRDPPAGEAEVLGRVLAIERRRGRTVLLDSARRRLAGRLLAMLSPLRVLAMKVLSGNRGWPKSRAGAWSAAPAAESQAPHGAGDLPGRRNI